MTATIITTSTTPLLRLLRVFDAESLGEGDLVAGANVLAAMCTSLANLHPPGSGLVTSEGNLLPVGMSFMTAGGLTNSLVGEQVLDPISSIQNNVADHLAADAAHSAATLAAMPPPERLQSRPQSPDDLSSAVGEIRMELDLNGISPARDSSPFQRLLGPSRHQGLGELAATPAVFLSADSPEGLGKQLSQAHRRYPYVRAVLADGPDSQGLERLLLAVVRGTSLPAGATGPIHVRGHVAASCAVGKLARLAMAGEETLAANLMWLVDGDNAAMSLTQGEVGSPDPYKMQHRYQEAVQSAWRTRLDYRIEPTTIQFDWQPFQGRWSAFLRKFEARSPGVTFAARPLLATLLFGCSLLHDPSRSHDWSLAGVVKLSEFLVERMVQRREWHWLAMQEARILELAIKLVEKLQEGPLDARGLTRKKSNLRIGDSRKVLGLLDRLGIARPVEDDKWKLTLSVAKAVERLSTPYVDV